MRLESPDKWTRDKKYHQFQNFDTQQYTSSDQSEKFIPTMETNCVVIVNMRAIVGTYHYFLLYGLSMLINYSIAIIYQQHRSPRITMAVLLDVKDTK